MKSQFLLRGATPRIVSSLAACLLLSACTTSPKITQEVVIESVELSAPAVSEQQSVNSIATTSVNDVTEPTTADFPALPAEATDVWARLRNNYSLPPLENKRIQREIDWYARHPNYMDRVNVRATPYMHYIISEIEKRGMPGEIALLPIVESAFQPFAYSHGRAAGIWQFIPGTGRHYGLKQNWWYDGRRDVYASTQAALNYLQRLNKIFKGDWMLALAAYNSGEGTVLKAVRRNKKRGKPTDFWSLRLPKETRSYVPRLLAIAKVIGDPESHGIKLATLENKPFFTRVKTKSQIDLALAAEMADISLDELYKLNPGFNRWATAPKGPHYLLIPVDKAEAFKTKIASLPDSQRMRWKHHKVKSGETLSHIADKYRISVALLKSSNRLRRNLIRLGQNLVIPVASKSARTYRLSETQRKKKILNSPKSGRHKVIHIVRGGDNLWDLSRKYKVNVRALAKWNAMAPRDVLQRGQKLIVWTKNAKIASTLTHSIPAPRSKAIMQRINYVVRRGDSLARIASRFRVRITDLLRWNTIKKNKYLQPGQRIKLFVDVTRQSS
ncbi:MAG: LysM peptidoglycan-binding domain-containing protein [Sulfuriflexus sp.]|nr:LysM peptidoglycan-binding domain-containing protein [Sulfuriflexus sp.]